MDLAQFWNYRHTFKVAPVRPPVTRSDGRKWNAPVTLTDEDLADIKSYFGTERDLARAYGIRIERVKAIIAGTSI